MRAVVTSSGSAPRPEVSKLSALFTLDGMGESIFIRVNGVTTCLNIYDIRLSDTHPACGMNWPPDLTYVKSYLQRDDIRNVFHASGSSESWSECRQAVWDNLHMDKSPPSVRLLPGLLEKIPIMLFSGDQDLVCNYLGAERMIEALEWNGATGFTNTTKPQSWKFNGTEAGEWSSERNLTYVKVYGASHMVGFDVPHIAHDMMLRFMGVDFAALLAGSAQFPSEVGGTVKPVIKPPPGNSSSGDIKLPFSEEDDPARWQAYYDAGSATLVLILIALAIGLFCYLRVKRRHRPPTLARDEEESIPLSRSMRDEVDGYVPVNSHDADGGGDKGRTEIVREDVAPPESREAIFDVGDDEDDERQ